MAWVNVPGSNGNWQYDNSPTLGTLVNGNAKAHENDQYYRANGTVSGGIRTFTPPGGTAQQTYVKCKKITGATNKIYTGTNATGPWSELSKNYYDAQ
jgi:hypothetical protein